jgi:hypothetical protein
VVEGGKQNTLEIGPVKFVRVHSFLHLGSAVNQSIETEEDERTNAGNKDVYANKYVSL